MNNIEVSFEDYKDKLPERTIEILDKLIEKLQDEHTSIVDEENNKEFKKYYQKIHVLKGFLLGLKERNKKQEEHLMKNMKANHKRNRNNDKLKKKYDNFFEIFDDITTVDKSYHNNCFEIGRAHV